MNGDIKSYSAMKNSGVDWLGEVPEHWEVLQLGRMGRFSKGSGGTKADEVDIGVPCIRYGDLYMHYKFFIRQSRSYVTPERMGDYTPIQYGDVLFAGSGETLEEIGKSAVNLIEQDAYCGGDVIIFRPAVDVEPRFMGYATDHTQAAHQKACMGRGVTIMHIYGDQLKYMWIALPPLDEQAAIIRLLDYVGRRVQRYVRAKQKLIALLEEHKQAIIHHAVTRGFDPRGPLKPSGVEWLGDVPEHWETKRLVHLLAERIRNGLYKSRDYYGDGGTPIIQMGEAFAEPIIERTALDRVHLSEEELDRWALFTNDLLFARRSIVFEGSGKCSIIGRLDEQHVYESSLIRVRPNAQLIKPRYLFLFMKSWFSRSQILSITKQVTISGIDGQQLKALTVLVPPLEEQDEMLISLDKKLSKLEIEIVGIRREIELLREYRNQLIADVVTGKLNVNEAAANLPEESDELDYNATEGDVIHDRSDIIPERAVT